jgi:hypothetical protein
MDAFEVLLQGYPPEHDICLGPPSSPTPAPPPPAPSPHLTVEWDGGGCNAALYGHLSLDTRGRSGDGVAHAFGEWSCSGVTVTGSCTLFANGGGLQTTMTLSGAKSGTWKGNVADGSYNQKCSTAKGTVSPWKQMDCCYPDMDSSTFNTTGW